MFPHFMQTATHTGSLLYQARWVPWYGVTAFQALSAVREGPAALFNAYGNAWQACFVVFPVGRRLQ